MSDAANDFTVQLTARDSQIRMNGTLPVSITGFFFIRVRFHSDGMRNESLISDSSFKDTNIVNFIIANEKLPNFQDFFVTVAIESDGVTGPYTTPSNRIGKGNIMHRVSVPIYCTVTMHVCLFGEGGGGQ